MEKTNYKFGNGSMPAEVGENDTVRVVMFDGFTEYDYAKYIDWEEVELYALIGED